MLDFAADFAESIELPAVLELVGDVGAGKTTFTRGLARGLNIKEQITSPSFTLSKRYNFSRHGESATLVHYDFYRLSDPGIMQQDLTESIADKKAIVVVEWADSVKELLPKKHLKLTFALNDDGSRTVEWNQS